MSYRYIIAFSFILALCAIIDLYTWYGLKKTVGRKYFKFFKWFIPLSTFLFFVGFIINIYRGGQGIHNANYFLNILTGFTFGVFLAKLLIASPFLIEDIFRVPIFLYRKIFVKNDAIQPLMPGRRKFVRNIALSLAAIPLTGTLYAITRGKYNYQVRNIKIPFPDLPPDFHGYKIVHFTDFHAGSFDSYNAVANGLALINEQEPDAVVFTGDLVNNRSAEVDPYLGLLQEISAKDGKFAVLGNHDYGEYMPFPTEDDKKANFEHLLNSYEWSNFQLLRNENIVIQRGRQKLIIAGVENWGNPPFPQYGDLDKALKDTTDKDFKILLSHDPDHWQGQIIDHPKNIQLTLSGHTHGAQFGIEIPNWRWSPVKYRYKNWLGHYQIKNNHLYVSKGFGFLGFPGRIGMYPEIVVIELQNEKMARTEASLT